MSNDPLALSDFSTGPLNEADYDAACAEVMATERGRRFLTEYANRVRHTDTHRLVGAAARVDAAIRDDRPLEPPAAATADLAGVAAAIERIEAEIAADDPPAPDGFAAIERIQDIAFMLHERPVEPTLCDALDAAAREISDVCARSSLAAERAQKVTGLLRTLANRVGETIALSVMDRSTEEPSAETAAAVDKHPLLPELGPLIGPEEDPGDLFELVPGLSSAFAPSVEESVPTVGPPLPSAGAAAAPGVSRPAVSDSLAAVRALSEEELIALFS